MKRLMLAGTMATMVFGAVATRAGDAAAPKTEKAVTAEKPAVAMDNLTLFGRVSKEQVAKTNRQGAAAQAVRYMLTDGEGNAVRLPKPKAVKGETAVDLDTFVDKQVEVTGKGKIIEHGAKKRILLVELTTIVEVAAPAATE